jgi:hypothetical protein
MGKLCQGKERKAERRGGERREARERNYSVTYM